MERLRGASGAPPCCACRGLEGGPPVGEAGQQQSPYFPRLRRGRRALLLLAAAAAACSLAAADSSAGGSRSALFEFVPGNVRRPKKEETAAAETAEKGDSAAAETRETVMRVSKPHVIIDCTKNDLEDIRQLLLATPEYPVKYSVSTMRSFSRSPHFFEMCVTAREVLKEPAAAEGDTETAAETDAETDEETAKGVVLGRDVGVVAAAEMTSGSANIVMVAVAKEFRRMGLAKRMIKAVLAKAGRLTSPSGGSTIHNAMLHVWVSQVAPLTLYLSLGFRPTKYLPFYYQTQRVKAGYEMYLPIPYETVEAAYQQQIRIKETKRTELEQALLETGTTLRFRGSSETDQFKPTAFVNAVASEAQLSDPLLTFLTKAAPEGGLDPSAALKQILGSPLPQLSFLAVEREGDVSGVIWVRSPPRDGLIDSVTLLLTKDKDEFKYLSLFGRLLTEASALPDVHGVQHKLPCEELSPLINSWKLGLKPVAFLDSGDRTIPPGYPAYEYIVETTLPWTPREELTLTLKSLLLDKEIAFAEKRLLPEAGAAGDAATPGTTHEMETQETAAGSSETAASSDSRAAKGNAAGPPHAGEAAPERSVAWYQTIAGVLGMIVGCSFLMFFCFRLCARRGQAAAAGSSQSGEAKRGSVQQQGSQETSSQRRPKGRKEGYSQVTEKTVVKHGADAAEPWWDQEDMHAFSAE